ncbi:hypothetical protein RSO01_93870 [Reyranella soli]|uniref:Uncharacterized protein n=1 Tax=Reyranella soli TaxID=1230389 RepID=A0A512NTG1_9HYPH|nr:hypothetical protein RSO01_93870 [Reyranella soli]
MSDPVPVFLTAWRECKSRAGAKLSRPSSRTFECRLEPAVAAEFREPAPPQRGATASGSAMMCISEQRAL